MINGQNLTTHDLKGVKTLNIMKKHVKKILMLAFILVLVSCSKENENSEILTKIVDVKFKTSSKAKNSSSTIVGHIEFTMNDDDEDFLDFKFSENILNQLTISEQEFYEMLHAEITINADGSTKNQPKLRGEDSAIAKCKKDCYDRLSNEDGSKKKGRGWCIAGCYVDEVIRVAAILVPIIIASN